MSLGNHTSFFFDRNLKTSPQARKSEEALANLHGLITTPGRAGARPSDATATLSPLTQVSDETLERAYAELTQPRDLKNDPQ